MQPPRLPKRSYKLLLIIFCLFLLGLGCFWGFNKWLVVKKVECGEGFSGVCLEVEKALLGQKLFALDTKALSERLLQVNPEIKNIGIKKTLTGKVTLDFAKREPLGVLVVKDKYYLFDKDAVVVKEISGLGVFTPVYLEGEPDIFMGINILPLAAVSAVGLLEAAQSAKVTFSQIKDLDTFLSAQLEGGVLGWFPLEANLNGRNYADMMSSLNKIMAQASLDKREISKIDFRYSKIVVE